MSAAYTSRQAVSDEVVDICDEPVAKKAKVGRPPSYVKDTCYNITKIEVNKSKRNEARCKFCDVVVRDEKLPLETHITTNCTKVTREIKEKVSDAIGSRAPAVSAPVRKPAKFGKGSSLRPLEVPSVSRTTPALAKDLDRKYVS